MKIANTVMYKSLQGACSAAHAFLYLGLNAACLIPASCVNAQSEELVILEFATGMVDTVHPFNYDTTQTFYSTDWNVGSMGNVQPLSLVPPTTDLWAGAQFNRPSPASEWMDVLSYPARTAAHLFKYVNGVRSHHCSANLVGRRHALVASHCLFSYYNGIWLTDSVSIAPSYDAGTEPLGEIMATKAYVPMKFVTESGYIDASLIELRDPIGDEAGWIGIASTADDDYFVGKVLHKFGYPGIVDPFDPAITYNGDTVYYRYGFVDPELLVGYLSVPGSEAHGVPGESGSSLFYTDNIGYLSFATSSWATNDRHQRIISEPSTRPSVDPVAECARSECGSGGCRCARSSSSPG